MADKRRRRAAPRMRPISARRGAVALEYILISALVAIALIASFRMWGITLFYHLTYVAWDSSAALVQVVPPR